LREAKVAEGSAKNMLLRRKYCSNDDTNPNKTLTLSDLNDTKPDPTRPSRSEFD